MKRGYQTGFYNSSVKVRDPISRQWQARKIAYALGNYAGFDLSSSLCLDIGCSSGIIASTLAPLFYQTIGLEYDAIALKVAEPATRAMVHLIRGDAMHLPFRDNTMNVIICAQVYEHVPDDVLLVEEIYRVLKPGGVVFFSGPNWLFPVEPHYSLPFLHWLPSGLANFYLRLTKRGDYYYERLRHLWGLRNLVHRFLVQDITLEVLQRFYLAKADGWPYKLIKLIPVAVWKILLPFFPGFNWILRKPME